LSAYLLLSGPGKKHIGRIKRAGKGEKLAISHSAQPAVCEKSVFETEIHICDDEIYKKNMFDTDIFNFSGAQRKWCAIMDKLRDIPNRNETIKGANKFDGEHNSLSSWVAYELDYADSGNFHCNTIDQASCFNRYACEDSHRDRDEAIIAILDSFVYIRKVSTGSILDKLANPQ
jgi:hypothetical protein